MQLPLFQVDAFTSKVFGGNPAAVVPLDAWPDDALLQKIALENNLSETAFIVAGPEGWGLRWFTPVREVALCGHATLASAHAIRTFIDPDVEAIAFHTRKAGILEVEVTEAGYAMTFPAYPPDEIPVPPGLAEIIGITPHKVLRAEYAPGEDDMMAVVASEAEVAALQPDMAGIAGLDTRGLIVTAKGSESDFVSRYFAPAAGVPEDPVTGSAHCVLTPYWAGVLGKTRLDAIQISARRGHLVCTLEGDRVRLEGQAAAYMSGTITV